MTKFMCSKGVFVCMYVRVYVCVYMCVCLCVRISFLFMHMHECVCLVYDCVCFSCACVREGMKRKQATKDDLRKVCKNC